MANMKVPKLMDPSMVSSRLVSLDNTLAEDHEAGPGYSGTVVKSSLKKNVVTSTENKDSSILSQNQHVASTSSQGSTAVSSAEGEVSSTSMLDQDDYYYYHLLEEVGLGNNVGGNMNMLADSEILCQFSIPERATGMGDDPKGTEPKLDVGVLSDVSWGGVMMYEEVVGNEVLDQALDPKVIVPLDESSTLHVTQEDEKSEPEIFNSKSLSNDFKFSLNDLKALESFIKLKKDKLPTNKTKNSKVMTVVDNKATKKSRTNTTALPNICPECGRGFKNIMAVKTHFRKRHTEQSFKSKNTNLRCEVCRKYYKTESLLIDHLYRHSTSVQCLICNQIVMGNKGSFTKHMNSHTSGPRKVCTFCKKSFKTPRGLKMHKCVQLSLQFECYICDKKFKSDENLMRHKFRFHGLKLEHVPLEKKPMKAKNKVIKLEHVPLEKKPMKAKNKVKSPSKKIALPLVDVESTAIQQILATDPRISRAYVPIVRLDLSTLSEKYNGKTSHHTGTNETERPNDRSPSSTVLSEFNLSFNRVYKGRQSGPLRKYKRNTKNDSCKDAKQESGANFKVKRPYIRKNKVNRVEGGEFPVIKSEVVIESKDNTRKLSVRKRRSNATNIYSFEKELDFIFGLDTKGHDRRKRRRSKKQRGACQDGTNSKTPESDSNIGSVGNIVAECSLCKPSLEKQSDSVQALDRSSKADVLEPSPQVKTFEQSTLGQSNSKQTVFCKVGGKVSKKTGARLLKKGIKGPKRKYTRRIISANAAPLLDDLGAQTTFAEVDRIDGKCVESKDMHVASQLPPFHMKTQQTVDWKPMASGKGKPNVSPNVQQKMKKYFTKQCGVTATIGVGESHSNTALFTKRKTKQESPVVQPGSSKGFDSTSGPLVPSSLKKRQYVKKVGISASTSGPLVPSSLKKRQYVKKVGISANTINNSGPDSIITHTRPKTEQEPHQRKRKYSLNIETMDRTVNGTVPNVMPVNGKHKRKKILGKHVSSKHDDANVICAQSVNMDRSTIEHNGKMQENQRYLFQQLTCSNAVDGDSVKMKSNLPTAEQEQKQTGSLEYLTSTKTLAKTQNVDTKSNPVIIVRQKRKYVRKKQVFNNKMPINSGTSSRSLENGTMQKQAEILEKQTSTELKDTDIKTLCKSTSLKMQQTQKGISKQKVPIKVLDIVENTISDTLAKEMKQRFTLELDSCMKTGVMDSSTSSQITVANLEQIDEGDISKKGVSTKPLYSNIADTSYNDWKMNVKIKSGYVIGQHIPTKTIGSDSNTVAKTPAAEVEHKQDKDIAKTPAAEVVHKQDKDIAKTPAAEVVQKQDKDIAKTPAAEVVHKQDKDIAKTPAAEVVHKQDKDISMPVASITSINTVSSLPEQKLPVSLNREQRYPVEKCVSSKTDLDNSNHAKKLQPNLKRKQKRIPNPKALTATLENVVNMDSSPLTTKMELEGDDLIIQPISKQTVDPGNSLQSKAPVAKLEINENITLEHVCTKLSDAVDLTNSKPSSAKLEHKGLTSDQHSSTKTFDTKNDPQSDISTVKSVQNHFNTLKQEVSTKQFNRLGNMGSNLPELKLEYKCNSRPMLELLDSVDTIVTGGDTHSKIPGMLVDSKLEDPSKPNISTGREVANSDTGSILMTSKLEQNLSSAKIESGNVTKSITTTAVKLGQKQKDGLKWQNSAEALSIVCAAKSNASDSKPVGKQQVMSEQCISTESLHPNNGTKSKTPGGKEDQKPKAILERESNNTTQQEQNKFSKQMNTNSEVNHNASVVKAAEQRATTLGRRSSWSKNDDTKSVNLTNVENNKLFDTKVEQNSQKDKLNALLNCEKDEDYTDSMKSDILVSSAKKVPIKSDILVSSAKKVPCTTVTKNNEKDSQSQHLRTKPIDSKNVSNLNKLNEHSSIKAPNDRSSVLIDSISTDDPTGDTDLAEEPVIESARNIEPGENATLKKVFKSKANDQNQSDSKQTTMTNNDNSKILVVKTVKQSDRWKKKYSLRLNKDSKVDINIAVKQLAAQNTFGAADKEACQTPAPIVEKQAKPRDEIPKTVRPVMCSSKATSNVFKESEMDTRQKFSTTSNTGSNNKHDLTTVVTKSEKNTTQHKEMLSSKQHDCISDNDQSVSVESNVSLEKVQRCSSTKGKQKHSMKPDDCNTSFADKRSRTRSTICKALKVLEPQYTGYKGEDNKQVHKNSTQSVVATASSSIPSVIKEEPSVRSVVTSATSLPPRRSSRYVTSDTDKLDEPAKSGVHSVTPKSLYSEYEQIKPFMCNICQQSFALQSEVTNHFMVEHLGKDITYSCCSCKLVLVDSELENHIQEHGTASGVDYVCNSCNKIFKNFSTVYAHTYMHRNANKTPFMCGICLKVFKNRVKYGEHMFRLHNQEKVPTKVMEPTPKKEKKGSPIISSFSFLQQLRKGYYARQKSEGGLVCTRSNETCTPYGSLPSHQLKANGSCNLEKSDIGIPTNSTVVSCQVCEESFISKVSLQKHMRIHDSTVKVEETCHGFAGWPESSDDPTKSVKKFGCKWCKMSFATSNLLTYHMKTHNSLVNKIKREDISVVQASSSPRKLRGRKVDYRFLNDYGHSFCEDLPFSLNVERNKEWNVDHESINSADQQNVADPCTPAANVGSSAVPTDEDVRTSRRLAGKRWSISARVPTGWDLLPERRRRRTTKTEVSLPMTREDESEGPSDCAWCEEAQDSGSECMDDVDGSLEPGACPMGNSCNAVFLDRDALMVHIMSEHF